MTESRRNPYSLRERLFSPPHLPGLLIIFALLIVVTSFYLILIGQPTAYWIDFDQAISNVLWIQQLLAIHPLVFLGVTAVYSLAIYLALRRLSAFHALILWMVISFIHLRGTIFDLSSNLVRFINLTEGAAYPIEFALYIVGSGILGLALTRTLPASQPIAAPSSDTPSWRLKFAHRATMVCVIAWLLLLTAGLVQAMYIPDTGWRPIATENSPLPRTQGEIAYDINRRRVVLFGGYVYENHTSNWEYKDGTWEWDGTNWEQRLPTESPPGRVKHAMAYDPVRGIVVLFGGHNASGDLGDTWVWDGEQWEQQYPQTIPQARCCHSMVYDPQSSGIVLYGGTSGEGDFFYDAWKWDGAEWIPVSLENPQPSSGHDMVYYEALNFILSARIWMWQGDTWSRLQSDAEPPERHHEGLAYDLAKEHVVMFGGVGEGHNFDDTWLLEGQVWRKLNLPLSPTARHGHVMFYDLKRESVVIFGGSDEFARNDMWELTLPVNE